MLSSGPMLKQAANSDPIPFNLGLNFYPKLVRISQELEMRPEDILAVMVSESQLNPSAYEPKYKGSGLIGFMPDTLKKLGFQGTWKDFIRLTGEQQLDYVKKYIEGHKNLLDSNKSFTSAGQYYVANFWPVALKLPGVKNGDPKTKIVEKFPQTDPTGKYSQKYLNIGFKISAEYEKKAYEANTFFDHNHKGFITYGDMIAQTEQNKNTQLYQNAIKNMTKSTGYQPKIISHQSDGSLTHFLAQITKFLASLANEEREKCLIVIGANDFETKLEYAKILRAVLQEELETDANIYGQNGLVEMVCAPPFPINNSLPAIQEICMATSEVFKEATKKMGGLETSALVIPNKKSNYEEIGIEVSEINSRKFKLKYAMMRKMS
jgi:Transglycosylase SLT domain